MRTALLILALVSVGLTLPASRAERAIVERVTGPERPRSYAPKHAALTTPPMPTVSRLCNAHPGWRYETSIHPGRFASLCIYSDECAHDVAYVAGPGLDECSGAAFVGPRREPLTRDW